MSKFKAFPKNGRQIDKEKVRVIYLNGPDFDWSSFCAAHGFNSAVRSDFPFRSWQREWIEKKTNEQQEMLVPKAFALRGKIANSRVDVIAQQLNCNEKLRSIFSAYLDAFPRPTSNVNLNLAMLPEFERIAKINKCLQDNEFQALLITAKTAAVNSSLGPIEAEDKLEEDELPEILIGTYGSPGVVHSGQEIAAQLATYFDQFEIRPTATVTESSTD
jgi:hypothetical protein